MRHLGIDFGCPDKYASAQPHTCRYPTLPWEGDILIVFLSVSDTGQLD